MTGVARDICHVSCAHAAPFFPAGRSGPDLMTAANVCARTDSTNRGSLGGSRKTPVVGPGPSNPRPDGNDKSAQLSSNKPSFGWAARWSARKKKTETRQTESGQLRMSEHGANSDACCAYFRGNSVKTKHDCPTCRTGENKRTNETDKEVCWKYNGLLNSGLQNTQKDIIEG
ncbi:hypothetical protein GWI33_004269 [Rhynchophorus ferrugineus]|uniref:Uncharacterized protein n=1 Tax=Rhynchophorus ferrugineus TaxID=354439 RepID=A0A834IXF5_RHYFE|nr:hypothetical protein GWI33_004269 [Rhynchophorus ferrugineus]